MKAVKELPPLTEQLLRRIVSALLSIDPDIVAVVLFGSAVYAPDLADLLVISKAPKERERYEMRFWKHLKVGMWIWSSIWGD